MSNQVSDILQSAFDLIEDNRLGEARELVEPLLETEPNNPAVWWVYAHAVEDSDEGTKALERVLELDPTYPGATELQEELVPAEASVDNSSDEDTKFDETEAEADVPAPMVTEVNNQSSWMGMGTVATLVVVVLAVLLIFALLNSGSGAPEATATTIADEPTEVPTIDALIVTDTDTETEEPTIALTDIPASDTPNPTDTSEPSPAEVEVTETESPPTATETVSDALDVESLLSSLTDLEIGEEDINIDESTLGETLTVDVCSPLGPESSIKLNEVMTVFVEQEASLPPQVEAVAVSLSDCEIDDSFTRTIGVTRELVASLANEEIELKDFQRAWQPLQ